MTNQNEKYGYYKDENGNDEFELSPYQQTFLDYRINHDASLFVCMGLRIRGKFNLEKFGKVINEVHQDYDAYRMRFVKKDDRYVYKIYNQYDFEFERVEVEGKDPEEKYANAQKDAYQKLREKIDIFNKNGARYVLYELGHQDIFLVIIHDHIISDADTMDVVMNRVMFKYLNLGLLAKKQKVSSHEYTQMQRANCLTAEGKEDLEYWKEQLKDYVPLPMREPLNPIDECQDNFYHRTYERKPMEDQARTMGSSAANMFAAACHLALMNLYKRDDTILSVVSSDRGRRYRNTVGVIVKCLENRMRIDDGEETLAEFLKRVTYKTSENFSHKDAHYIRDLSTMYTFFELNVKDVEKPINIHIWLPQENVMLRCFNIIVMAYPDRLEFAPSFSLLTVDREEGNSVCETILKVIDLYMTAPETKLKEVVSFLQDK